VRALGRPQARSNGSRFSCAAQRCRLPLEAKRYDARRHCATLERSWDAAAV